MRRGRLELRCLLALGIVWGAAPRLVIDRKHGGGRQSRLAGSLQALEGGLCSEGIGMTYGEVHVDVFEVEEDGEEESAC